MGSLDSEEYSGSPAPVEEDNVGVESPMAKAPERLPEVAPERLPEVAPERPSVVDKVSFSSTKKLRGEDGEKCSGIVERWCGSFPRIVQTITSALAQRRKPEKSRFWTKAQLAIKGKRNNFITKMPYMRTVHEMKK